MSAARGQVSDLLRPWYQKKSLTLSHEVPLDESLYSPDFASRVTEDLKTLLPFYRFAAPLRRGGIRHRRPIATGAFGNRAEQGGKNRGFSS